MCIISKYMYVHVFKSVYILELQKIVASGKKLVD